MKKSLALILFLAAGFWLAFHISPPKKFTQADCPFCDPRVLSAQEILRGTSARALLNYKPAIEGHMLIIPKRHVERFEDLTKQELEEIHALIVEVDRSEQSLLGATGYILLQKNGVEAGQSVPHVHFHYVPRTLGQSNLWMAIKMFLAPWLKPLTALEIDFIKSRFEGQAFGD